MPVITRLGTCVVASVLLLAGCGKTPDAGIPLGYAPADTPYVFGNIEPMPQAMIDRYATQFHESWPMLIGYYQEILNGAEKLDDPQKRVAQAILNEFKTRDSLDKLREIGLRPDAHMALYGVGVIPVLRLELGDAAAFKAFIGRIEQNSGQKLDAGKVGEQDYWSIGKDGLEVVMAVQGNQVVLTLSPKNASEDLRKKLLGMTRPDNNILQVGALDALNQKFHYLPNGSGYLDVVRLVDLISSGSDPVLQEFSTALGSPAKALDAACRTDALSIAQKFPRLSFGYEALTAQRMQVGFQLELDAALAKDVMAASAAAPGSAAPSDSLLDISIAIPVLKLKDFWQKQAKAIVAKPYTCSEFADLNKQSTDAVEKLDSSLPPPFSDFNGMRFSLNKLEPKGAGVPEFSGKLLLSMSNPTTTVAMAQLVVPTLKDLKLSPDSKPVPLSLGAMAAMMPPMFVAMSPTALAISTGAGEETGLAAYLAAPAASQPVFMRMSFSGAIYGLLGKFGETIGARMGDKERAQMAKSAQMMAVYEKWIRRGDMQFSATPNGIAIEETIDMN